MWIKSLIGVSVVFVGIAIVSISTNIDNKEKAVTLTPSISENEPGAVMSFEDKLLTVLNLSEYKDIGIDAGMTQFSQDDFLVLLDIGLEQGYQPGAAFSLVVEVLADQPDLLNKTLQKLQAHNISYVYS
jgi:hypothetical protein